MKLILVLAFIFAVAGAGLLGSLWAFQKWGIYKFRPAAAAPNALGFDNLNIVNLPSSDGRIVNVWVALPDNMEAVLLTFHGNYTDPATSIAKMAPLVDDGIALVMMEYAMDAPSDRKYFADAKRIYDNLGTIVGSDVDKSKVFLHGFSVGCVFASNLAANRDVAGLILEAAGPGSPTYFGRRAYGLPIFHLMWRERLELAEDAMKASTPKLFIHGALDPWHLLSDAQEIYESLEEPKKIIVYENGKHDDLSQFGALEEISAFVLR